MGKGRERIGEGEVEGGEGKGREGKGLGCPLALARPAPNAEFLDQPMAWGVRDVAQMTDTDTKPL